MLCGEFSLNRHVQFSCAIKNRLRPSILHLRLGEHPIKRFKRGVWLLRGVEGDSLAVVGVRKLRSGRDGLFKQLDRFFIVALASSFYRSVCEPFCLLLLRISLFGK